jgi:hypothetical protein
VPGSSSSAVEGQGGSSRMAKPGHGQHGRLGQRTVASAMVSGVGDGVEHGRRCQVRPGSRVDWGWPKRK